MNQDDNNGQNTSPDENEEQFDSAKDAFDEEPRRLEPVFADFELTESEEASYDDSQDDSFEDSRYNPDYEEDSIDYDMDPESLMDEEPTGEPTEALADWQGEGLKPELQRPLESDPEPNLDPEQDDTSEWRQETPYYDTEEDDTRGHWPVGLIIVAVFALLLLGAGGYGVMQQRAAMQEEIRTLQAAMATSASPDEISASNQTQSVLEERNRELEDAVADLEREVSSLRDTARGLEAQLTLAQSRVQEVEKEAKKVAKPVAAAKPAAPKPAPAKKATQAAAQGWFVNFGSYQKKATANSWAGRLAPAGGSVVVLSGEKNGTTFYRVRVIDLDSKEQAEKIARALEREHDLTKLWIGRQ
ncbi:MAG: SPOR domain-containing protein [Halioglobus sp.]